MWIKICGITTVEDALTVADAGASAIGLNFYRASPRCVTRAQARLITDRVSEDIDVVGLFVSDPAHRAAQIVGEVGLTAVQFHGDQSPSEIQRFQQLCPHTPVIRAFRVGSATKSFQTQWQEFDVLSTPLTAILVDAWSPERYGGTGQIVESNLLNGSKQLNCPLILAGGLTPDNVADALTTIRPWGVDTASGVEISPGVKSAELVKRFVNVCRQVIPGSQFVRLPSQC